MEEKILEILRNNYVNISDVPAGLRKSAGEITAYIMEFIEWVLDNCLFLTDNKGKYYFEIIMEESISDQMTIDELFDYWLKNIKHG
jgi:hypothetical protein